MSSTDLALVGDRTPDIIRSIVEKSPLSLKREDKRITTDRLIGCAICLRKEGSYLNCLYRDAAITYIEGSVQDESTSLDIVYHASRGREVCRELSRWRHRHYQQPCWATCHVEDIDRMYAAKPYDADDEVRIDFDAVGGSIANAHDRGENLNLSMWLTWEQARELDEDLVAKSQEGVA